MTSKQEVRTNIIVGVSLICDMLTDLELSTLNIVVQLNENPHGRIFDYEKVKSLFTEAEGMIMHDETKLALVSIVNKRLAK